MQCIIMCHESLMQVHDLSPSLYLLLEKRDYERHFFAVSDDLEEEMRGRRSSAAAPFLSAGST